MPTPYPRSVPPKRRRPGRTPRQLSLPLPPGRGGKRRGAGRKPSGPRAGIWHVRRPEHDSRHPVHVTLRVNDQVRGLRTKHKLAALRTAIGAGSNRFGFRIVHFAIQGDHIHLIVEADDRVALRRGLQGLSIRLAKSLNRRLERHGKVFADRYHARALATPTETRRALAYVLANHRHHTALRGVRYGASQVDPFSSALDFDGWCRRVRPLGGWRYTEPVTVTPETWLLRAGWKRAGGLLDPAFVPGAGRASPPGNDV